ncbi:site-specific integrase [Methylobacterium sp. WL6]|uniref:site-specific integrase n=1 Tax=Methylobacterium sp. WL6 TaxID=2603901 RepID=UPI0011C86834|nr:site-specific integrase [Methylobacterium sp. WL6]TXN68133.1 site-specific integrase [Methylobacterium sp. WL6]
MATIRKRNDKWHVQVRRKGSATVTRSFLTKTDAQTWARQTETQADRRGLPVGLRTLDTLTVGDIMVRYRDTVTPTKRGAVREAMAVKVLLKHAIAKVPLSALTVAKVAAHRDLRLRTVKPASINRELALYRHAFEVARKVWDVPLSENPFALVVKPKVLDARTRRLEAGEWEVLREGCRRSRNPNVLPMVELGLETAMRRGEVLRLRWQDIDWTKRTLLIPTTKNGHARTIPLTGRALAVLRERMAVATWGELRVFPTTEDAVKTAWRWVMKRAPLPDFRYHDLRHEAVSRFFELGLSIPEVALISGHRDTRMLMRYTHLRPEALADKLAKLGAPVAVSAPAPLRRSRWAPEPASDKRRGR